jgi:hypothetical protein
MIDLPFNKIVITPKSHRNWGYIKTIWAIIYKAPELV